ncbi:nicotinate-nucleotide adenylyltransferase [Natronobacillus azotifigens]|uniref:Probable nicotinate-nucleotide adenylyltransferase n=1 Tax=Natronobacillus azotifigens TaxID=472978 RepID=A0A9J6R9G6_9BACI|nr:nicotinate-nucleotide adenylyltransferase [Natronobacillus azotifigens]MCZ0702322.1 nicotinate-nucleotide adenylyltransferase [Natronobacillus azotifigens]
MKKVGLLGGTFDPPHLGHLLIAEEVYEQLKLDEVWFIPSGEPPHKEKASVSARDRVDMVESAIQDNHHFSINTIEVNRLGKSYTVDTIEALLKEYPNNQFYFIIGADMVEYLPKWSRIDKLIEQVQFVGVKRPDYELNTTYPIIALDIPELAISSTEIRKRLANNRSIRYLVPEKVLEVIKERKLYESS